MYTSQDICFVRMKDTNDFLTIYGHRANIPVEAVPSLTRNIKFFFLPYIFLQSVVFRR